MRDIKFRAILKRESRPRDVLAIDFMRLLVLVSISGSPEWHEYKKLIEYTGLKDKNGKEIYEGDICKHRYYNTPVPVNWSDGMACFYADDVNMSDNSLEVIGNIYENSELLEAK